VQEGNPRVIQAVLKVPPPVPPGPDAELIQARVFFATKLSEGLIETRISVEEALQIAMNAEKETITGQWRIIIIIVHLLGVAPAGLSTAPWNRP
jgi:hypothetical protein